MREATTQRKPQSYPQPTNTAEGSSGTMIDRMLRVHRKTTTLLLAGAAILCSRGVVDAFQPVLVGPTARRFADSATTTTNVDTSRPTFLLQAHRNKQETRTLSSGKDGGSMVTFPAFLESLLQSMQKSAVAAILGLSLLIASPFALTAPSPAFAATTDPSQIVGCLFQKCSVQLGKCVLNPKCLANVVCINTCTGRPDEIDCQIKCGDIFENEVVGEFNKCVVSDMSCVPQQPDDGSYPVPIPQQVVPKFDTKFFNGKLYITAGQNPLFDIFDCQVHFFTETEPGRFFGKLNWRVTEPDGEFFTRDALQEFYQDPKDPSHLINHDNEYLHYKDDWWIIDYEYDNNPDKLPPFAFVYYRGSNDAWDGYGGVVVYTRAAALPTELIPRLREAAKKVNFDWDKDFTVTDNSCPSELSAGEKLLLREKFAGKAILQTEEQIQAQATRLRGNVVNSVKAQKLFFENRFESAGNAYNALQKDLNEFEEQSVGN